MTVPVIEVRDLHFSYRGAPREVLAGVDLTVRAGRRVLVIGANGAGKTTLLRIIAGKHMVDPERVRVLGTSAFHDPTLSGRIDFLGGRFPFDVDLRVDEILGRQIDVDPARRDHLLEVLGVDLDLIARQDLLAFLRRESEQRGTTILYATHIFDTLDRWATDVIYLVAGVVVVDAPIAGLPELAGEPLVSVVERWLRRDMRRP